MPHLCAFRSVAGAGLRKRRREGLRGMGRKKGRRGEEKRGRKAQRGTEREAHRDRSAGSLVMGTESLFFLTQGRTPPPPLLGELTCPSSWCSFIFPTQWCLCLFGWALSTLISFLFILMENHEVLSGPQYNLGPLGVSRRRILQVWWGLSAGAFPKPHVIPCRTVSLAGGVGGRSGVPNLERVNKNSQGSWEGSLPRRPFHLPHRLDTASSALTGSKEQWLGTRLETSWWKIPHPYGENRIVDVKQTH